MPTRSSSTDRSSVWACQPPAPKTPCKKSFWWSMPSSENSRARISRRGFFDSRSRSPATFVVPRAAPIKRPLPIDPDSLEGSQGGSPFEKAAHAERIQLLHDLLEQLDDEKRQVFILSELEQMPQVEIAEALDIHVNTVAYRLRAAQDRLQQLLQRFYARAQERTS